MQQLAVANFLSRLSALLVTHNKRSPMRWEQVIKNQ